MANKDPGEDARRYVEKQFEKFERTNLANLADENPIEGETEFKTAVFEFGLKLIEDYKDCNCRDSNKTLDAIIEIFKASMSKN